MLVIGAGLSGIGAACWLRRAFPGCTLAVLESRDAIGGTWDTFRYPGVRSDSEMYTLAYRFRPWRSDTAIADGKSILGYLHVAAQAGGIGTVIRLGHRVLRAEWSSSRQRWQVAVARTDTGTTIELSARFLICCTGYFRHERGYVPELGGREHFPGAVVHPQSWPSGLDVVGKRVIVIGSGATAVTLAPSLVRLGAQVTIVQRSPSYILPRDTHSRWAPVLRRVLPTRVAYALLRIRGIAADAALYRLSRSHPNQMRRWIRGRQRRYLTGCHDPRHFEPRYDPWTQRMCVAADADLFHDVASGAIEMVTDTVTGFTGKGLQLASNTELAADIVVTATGFDLQVLGGIDLIVDGAPVRVADRYAYKAAMLSGVPNLLYVIGYVNAAWTLKLDLLCQFMVRLLRHMKRHGHTSVTPEPKSAMTRAPFIADFLPGYFLRSGRSFPSQGDRKPWRLTHTYWKDMLALRFGRLDDGALQYSTTSE